MTTPGDAAYIKFAQKVCVCGHVRSEHEYVLPNSCMACECHGFTEHDDCEDDTEDPLYPAALRLVYAANTYLDEPTEEHERALRAELAPWNEMNGPGGDE